MQNHVEFTEKSESQKEGGWHILTKVRCQFPESRAPIRLSNDFRDGIGEVIRFQV